MVILYSRSFSRVELERYVGEISQIGGLTPLELADGHSKGVRCILLRTGVLSALVVVDRGLDVANLEYKGTPLAWMSPTGITAPAFYEPEGLGWLRGFFGGLLTTCGLTYFGRPTVDEGEQLGLHGRASYIPAKLHLCRGRWAGDSCVLEIEGEVRESKVFEPNISLYRRIEAELGGSRIVFRDHVRNNGWYRQPFMILYHFNLGFPLLSRESKLVTTSRLVVPRDSDAAEGAENYDRFEEPTRGYREKVYFHDLVPDQEGYAYAALLNYSLAGGLGVVIRFKRKPLNRLVEWKMMGEGTYVLGIEPANGLVLGRDFERRVGTLKYLEPQEEQSIEIELKVVEGVEELRRVEERIIEIRGPKRATILSDVETFVREARE
jgi:hypothetical protein